MVEVDGWTIREAEPETGEDGLLTGGNGGQRGPCLGENWRQERRLEGVLREDSKSIGAALTL